MKIDFYNEMFDEKDNNPRLNGVSAYGDEFNTYVNKGLPPGPISLVSLESIKAALQPEMSSYYYFVSRGDGTHQFSATLEQHNKAVKEYQLK
jgi:cell division protein YceG involved in septum cleavage